MRSVSLCHEKCPAGVLVQPVDDARTKLPANCTERFGVRQQRVRERRLPRRWRRMNRQARRLVNYEEVLVLEQNIEGHRLGPQVGRLPLGDRLDNNLHPGLKSERWLPRRALDQDATVLDVLGNSGAALIRQRTGEEPIQSLTPVRRQSHASVYTRERQYTSEPTVHLAPSDTRRLAAETAGIR